MRNPIDFLRGDYDDNTDVDDDIKCERLIKAYDGKSIEISGLNFGGFQIGKFGIEPKLLQTVSHALMLLDASQYDLCVSVKNVKDKDTREKYIKLMTDDKLAAQRIFRALAGLLINPESTQMQDAVKDTLLSTLASNESRTIDIENSKLLTKIDQPQPLSTTANQPTSIKDNVIEIGDRSFKEKINDIRQSYQISTNGGVWSSSHNSTIQNVNLKQQLKDIRNVIVALNNEYTISLVNGLNVVEFWLKLGEVLQQLTTNSQYRKVIGATNAESLDRIMIKIGTRVGEFKEADDLGDKSEANIAKKEVTLYFGQVFRRMDDIYSSI